MLVGELHEALGHLLAYLEPLDLAQTVLGSSYSDILVKAHELDVLRGKRERLRSDMEARHGESRRGETANSGNCTPPGIGVQISTVKTTRSDMPPTS